MLAIQAGMSKRTEEKHDAATIIELRSIAQGCQDRGDKAGVRAAELAIEHINIKSLASKSEWENVT